ncbi:MAG: sugar ABC transporter ATP-binding protein [Planctomycetota bacterium]
MTAPRLSARGIGKRFPGVRALHGVDLEVGAGEVVAVLGENGAGKSTLMKILAGVQLADEGELRFEGRPVRFGSVREAERHGVVLIHQELNLCDNLSIGASMFLGREPRRGWFVDEAAIAAGARRALDRLGVGLDPGTRIEDLSLAQRQLVEIARAIAIDARVVIMDEPTSSLGESDAERLFDVVDELRRDGVSVLYISHRLAEIERLADRVVVLRDGGPVGELVGTQIARDAMVRMMVGRELGQFFHRSPHAPGAVALGVTGLRTRAFPGAAVDLTVRCGEVVGLAGLVGAGRSEMLKALAGVEPGLGGAVCVSGRSIGLPQHPSAAIRAGVALVPEDRKAHGALLDLDVRQNIGLGRLSTDARRGFVDRAKEAGLAARMIAELGIRTPDDRQSVRFLSGGNQQKVVLARWLATEPAVLLLDEPTRGVDVGAKEEIYALLDGLARRGMAILFASSELEEVLGLSDRVLVVRDGRIQGELSGAACTEEAVMQLATADLEESA